MNELDQADAEIIKAITSITSRLPKFADNPQAAQSMVESLNGLQTAQATVQAIREAQAASAQAARRQLAVVGRDGEA